MEHQICSMTTGSAPNFADERTVSLPAFSDIYCRKSHLPLKILAPPLHFRVEFPSFRVMISIRRYTELDSRQASVAGGGGYVLPRLPDLPGFVEGHCKHKDACKRQIFIPRPRGFRVLGRQIPELPGQEAVSHQHRHRRRPNGQAQTSLLLQVEL